MRRSISLTLIAPAALAAAALALVPALPAAAHNYVVSSTPAEGETLTSVPEFFVITTNEALLDLTGEGAGFVMQVSDESGLFYGDGCVSVQGPSMAMAGALGPAGEYTLAYQAISGDGHTISDELSFRYEPAAGTEAQAGVATAPDCGATAAGDAVGDPGSAPADEASTVIGVIVGLVVGAVVFAVVVALILRRRSGAEAVDTEAAAPPEVSSGT